MWYTVSLLFERLRPGSVGQGDPLYEESIRVVDAGTEEEAAIKAKRLGKTEHVRFPVVTGENVEWRFVQVISVYELLEQSLKDGTEVFSRFLVRRPESGRPLSNEAGSGKGISD